MRTGALHLQFNLCLLITISCLLYSSFCDTVSLSSHEVNFSSYCQNDSDTCLTGCLKNNTIYIQGFVPIDNDVFTAAESLVPASWVAIDDVNCNCSILPNHRLRLDFVDTKCDPAQASYQAIKSIERQTDENQIVMFFFGGACSLETEPLATIAGNFYKIPTVSYGASSPSLSNRHLFPNFFRTIPSEIQANSARFALMEKYNWRKVATLHETESLFALAAEDFHHQYEMRYEQNNGLVLRSFTDTPEVQLQQIKDEDIRIIMGYFYEDKAIETLCLAYHMELTTPSHVWVLPAWYTRNWYYKDYSSNTSDVSCTKDQLREAVKYSFFLDSYNESSNATNIGRTNSTEKFTEKLNCYLEKFKDHLQTGSQENSELETHLYSGFAYDAVWTIAYALNKTEQELVQHGYNLTLDSFDYFEANNLSNVIARHLVETDFAGVSGPVTFDENGTRAGLTGIYQLREKSETTSVDEFAQVLIAVYYPGLSRDSVSLEYLPGLEPVWKGGEAPSDRKVPQKVYLNHDLIISGYTFAAIGLVAAVVVLIFNFATLWKPLVKHSAPHMNGTAVVGCIVLLLGSLLLGVDSNHPVLGSIGVFHSRPAAICTLRLWILTLGFTMSFGALFCKMCLIFHVHINTELKEKQPKMWNFVLMMIILITFDVVFLTFWTTVYPFEKAEVSIDHTQDLTLQFEICKCDHFGFLIGTLYIYKGLLSICGLFLAYESRNVKYFYINDSRFVSIAMYIVVILVGIGAPLSLVLAVLYAIDAAYEVAVITIIAACLSTLLVLYLPKLYYMIKGEDTLIFGDDHDESTGSEGPRDSVIDTSNAKISQVVKNSLELDQFENSVNISSSFNVQKATEAGKTVADGNNPQIKVEQDATSPMTVRMRTAWLGQ